MTLLALTAVICFGFAVYTHKEVRHDFRRPQEEACHLSCDVPALSSEKGGRRTIFDSKLCVEM